MDEVALLFPGQGSQFVGMGIHLFEFPEARNIFALADQILPEAKLTRLCFEGPDETLRFTLNAQPAIFTVSVACFEVFKRQNHPIKFVAGHSVGEYGALVAAEVIPFQEALRLVRRRGELMHEAGRGRPGAMAVILRLPVGEVERVCQEASNDKIVEVANLNSPAQVVVSGDAEAVEEAGELAKRRGAKRVLPIPVSGAFHSELMQGAAQKLSTELDKIKFGNARFPVVCNVTGKPVTEGETIRALLKEQVRKRVLWEDSVRFMLNSGIHTFVEMEPGTILSGLVRSIDKSAITLRPEKACGV